MRIRSQLLAAGVAAALAVTLTACSDSDPAEQTPQSGNQYAAGDLTLDARPEHIVSLSAAATEMLFAIDAGDQVTAVDQTSNYPDGVPTTDLDAFTPNVEAIAGYEPDLVVLSHDQEDIVAKLAEVNIPVYYAPAATTVDDTYQQITDLGALTGHSDEAETLTTQMAGTIDELVGGLPQTDEPLSVYYELDPNLYSLTSQTFAGSLLALAGLENIADAADDAEATGGYPQLSQEFVLDADPDLIFVTVGGEEAVEELLDRDGWDTVSAVKNHNVVALDEDIASRWGPRIVDLMGDITDAVVQAA